MRPRADAGFTLLEIVVALAVFGFLLVGLSQTVRFGLAAWRQDARLSESKVDLDGVDRSLRSVVENLAPSDDAGAPAIVGTANSLTGRSRLRVPGSGAAAIRVEAGLAVSGNRLVLRWRPYHHWEPFVPEPPPQEAELAAGVARLGIAYWQAKGGWTSGWHDPDLPLLIRLRVTFAGEDAPRWRNGWRSPSPTGATAAPSPGRTRRRSSSTARPACLTGRRRRRSRASTSCWTSWA